MKTRGEEQINRVKDSLKAIIVLNSNSSLSDDEMETLDSVIETIERLEGKIEDLEDERGELEDERGELEDHNGELETELNRLQAKYENIENMLNFGDTVHDEYKLKYFAKYIDNYTPWEIEELLKSGKDLLKLNNVTN